METLAIYLTIGAVFAIKKMVDVTWNRHGLADMAGRMLEGRSDGIKVAALVLMLVGTFLFWPIDMYAHVRIWWRRYQKAKD